MNAFAANLAPENKANFSTIRLEMVLSYLRQGITENVLEGDENNFFDLFAFSRKHNLPDSALA